MSGWTKEQFIEQAFSEIGISPDVFNVGPDKMQRALRNLDSMMATWDGKGIRLGYPLPGTPEASDIAQETGVPDKANEAIYSSLAIRIAPSLGKQVPQDLRIIAKDGYDMLLRDAAFPSQQQMPNTLPRGAGNKPWRMANRSFMPTPVDPLLADEGEDQITFE
jgi:P22 tail accessory factor.